MKPIILIGGGGHCKSVIDVAESSGYTILGILDQPKEVGKTVLGYKVIGTDDDMAKYADVVDFVITVGQIKTPDLRIKLYHMIKQTGGTLATIISPTACVSRYATVGVGTVVLHNAVVNADASIGKCCIVNTSAVVEHDVVIDDFCHISTGAIINGGAVIGDKTFVGSQSVVNQGISITGGGVTVASLSVINKNITSAGIYAGNPAVPIRLY